MKSVIFSSCVGSALAAATSVGVRGTVGLDAAAEEAAAPAPALESKKRAAYDTAGYRKAKFGKFDEASAVVTDGTERAVAGKGKVRRSPVEGPRTDIIMPIVFDGVHIGYPPQGIPQEYIGAEMFGKKARAKLPEDHHGHGPQVLAGIGSEPYYRYMGWDENGKNMINALFDPRVMQPEPPSNWFTEPQDVTHLPYNNFMAYIFADSTEFRWLWTYYSTMKTPAGYTFTEGAKTGIDNPGHPNIIPCGFMFTDEYAPDIWQEFTDEMMFRRHKWHPVRDYFHSSDLAGSVPSLRVDPTVNDALMQGMFIKTSRIRTGRSIKGFPLPPSITFQQRRGLEQTIVKALESLGETDYAEGFQQTLRELGMEGQKLNLEGKYYPEFMSKSMSAFTTEDFPSVDESHFANGMDKETNRRLLASGNAFQHPDSTLLLSTGCARHWPDARGVWENADSDLFVWVSEEDHMRIVSMERGGNFQKVWMRFISGIIEIEEAIKETGYEYILNERYGYILSCPSNTGAGIRAGSHIRMAYLPMWANGELGIEEIDAAGYTGGEGGFKGFAEAHRLQGRGQGGVDDEGGGAIVDLSNVDRIGYSEAQLVTFAIKGMAGFVRLEMRLHFYKLIESFEKAVATGDAEKIAQFFANMKAYLVEDKDKDGTIVQSGEWSGSYTHDLLDVNGAYIQEFANANENAQNPEIIEMVASARAAGEAGNYAQALAELKNIQPLLLNQFMALKQFGLTESETLSAQFRAEQKALSDEKQARAMSINSRL